MKKRMVEMTYTLLKEDRLEASAFSSIMAEIDEREQRIAAESDRKRQLLARNQYILNSVQGPQQMVDFIFCTHCGNKMPRGAKFCTGCGTKLS